MPQLLGIPKGFGSRLREERERIGWSQEALAVLGGVKRLAQSQYEKEASSPTVRYLAALASAGIDLEYVLFGGQTRANLLSLTKKNQIESQAFEQLEAFVRQQPVGHYGAEARFALFQMLRANLTQAAIDSRMPGV
jgi:transcriptional regulator with XRE-family HTH domain